MTIRTAVGLQALAVQASHEEFPYQGAARMLRVGDGRTCVQAHAGRVIQPAAALTRQAGLLGCATFSLGDPGISRWVPSTKWERSVDERAWSHVDVQAVADRNCPRCDRKVLLSAQMPHGWENPDGTRVEGTLTAFLCPECDSSSPGAAPLITFFQVHEQVDPENLHECADLIRNWIATIEFSPVDTAKLEEEYLAWRNGEL